MKRPPPTVIRSRNRPTGAGKMVLCRIGRIINQKKTTRNRIILSSSHILLPVKGITGSNAPSEYIGRCTKGVILDGKIYNRHCVIELYVVRYQSMFQNMLCDSKPLNHWVSYNKIFKKDLHFKGRRPIKNIRIEFFFQ